MDPVACWKNICSGVANGEDQWEDAFEEIDNLHYWLSHGGFRPIGVPFGGELKIFKDVLKMIHKQR